MYVHITKFITIIQVIGVFYFNLLFAFCYTSLASVFGNLCFKIAWPLTRGLHKPLLETEPEM